MQVCASLWATFTGGTGNGGITLTGAKVGDIVALVYRFGSSSQGGLEYYYETTISVAGQIQQINSQDLSGLTIGVLLLRPITTT